ncbi:hypothetical protein [Kutzneria buriramensis]|uniref:Uncharacterized protein n=1 Tax=Kutzneria buriramensis TaxID=1045776 RepID=A0A3E0GUB4_9PSEU|nr:hypothetical protein [Kutzneria buriramensis]REH28442.1 hypothetical protein BCF44_12722 [Kutzneria buriramensis]
MSMNAFPAGWGRPGANLTTMTDTHDVTGRRAFLSTAVKIATGVAAAAALPTLLSGAASAAPLSTQNQWRFCQKCYGLFFWGYPTNGVCPAGADHSAQGFNFTLSYDVAPNANAQDNWHFCQKCFGMFFRGYPTDGVCPAGGGHDAQGFNFVLTHDVAPTGTAQNQWRFCQKCFGQFYWGYPGNGVCPAGADHSAQGYNFVLSHFS